MRITSIIDKSLGIYGSLVFPQYLIQSKYSEVNKIGENSHTHNQLPPSHSLTGHKRGLYESAPKWQK